VCNIYANVVSIITRSLVPILLASKIGRFKVPTYVMSNIRQRYDFGHTLFVLLKSDLVVQQNQLKVVN